MSNNKRYPKVFCSSGRQGLVFSAGFNMQTTDNQQSPMDCMASWSSITLNFANSEKNTGGNGNIEETHLSDVVERTKYAIGKIMEAEAESDSAPESEGQAAIEKLSIKISYLPLDMKDKAGTTAWELAKLFSFEQCSKASENLQKQQNSKYAASNQKQGIALYISSLIVNINKTIATGGNADQAIAYINGNYPEFKCLIGADVSSNSGKEYTIYNAPFKTPHIASIDANGLTKAYSLKVVCRPKAEYPFHCELTTMKGRPSQGKFIGIDRSTITDRQTFAIDLMSWEWLDIVEKAEKNRSDLYETFFYTNYSKAQKMIEEDRFAYQQGKQASVSVPIQQAPVYPPPYQNQSQQGYTYQ